MLERFARGSSGARRSDGAGLGLSIVQAIARAHGGRVTLESIVGRGTTVGVVLPARLATPEPDDPVDPSDTVDEAEDIPAVEPGDRPAVTPGAQP